MTIYKPKPYDPQHPYSLTGKGCGHGVLFKDYCKDCEIVSLQEEHSRAAKTIARVRNKLRMLGAPMYGQTSLPPNAPSSADAKRSAGMKG